MVYDKNIIQPSMRIEPISPNMSLPAKAEFNLELMLLLEYITLVMASLESLMAKKDSALPLNLKIILQRFQAQLKDLYAEAAKFKGGLEAMKELLPPALKAMIDQVARIQQKIEDILNQLKNLPGNTLPPGLFEEFNLLHQELYELKSEIFVLLQQVPESELEELRKNYETLFPREDRRPKEPGPSVAPPSLKTEAKKGEMTASAPTLIPIEEQAHVLDFFLRAKTLEFAQQAAPFQFIEDPAQMIAKAPIAALAELSLILQAIQETPIALIATHPEMAQVVQAMQQNLPFGFIVPYPYMVPPVSDLAGGEKINEDEEGEDGRKREEPKQTMVIIPGDFTSEPFLLADTPVANAAFAAWLNRRFKEKKLFVSRNGQLKDDKGEVLCLTVDGHPASQIQLSFTKGEMSIRPVPGTEKNPVVLVSYYGAQAFCLDNGMRLPTEAEWQRAAGRFVYGCGRDEIDSTLANYAESLSEAKPGENRTTPVGFYNGASVFVRKGKSLKTQNGMSPFGCYDLSGNVREWVEEKVAKGGSYRSLAPELKVSERVSLDPRQMDPYTGFRSAMDLYRT